MLLIFILSSGLVAVMFSDFVLASEAMGDSWNTMAPMNQARGRLGAIAVDGKLYAIGGSLASFASRNETEYMATNECYDPTANTWVTLAPMPTPRYGFAIATYDGKIYCIGGYGYNESSLVGNSELGVNEVYDVVANSWNIKAALPVSGGSLQAQVVAGKIFVIDQLNGTLFMYDPASDIWVAKTELPSWGRGLVSAVVDDKIIVTGKFYFLIDQRLTNERKILIYDIKTDRWNEGTLGPEVDAHTSAAGATSGLYVPQKVYVFYGGLVTATLVYDPVTDGWSDGRAMPVDRFSFDVAVIDDVFYVLGGFPALGGEPLAVNEQYVPADYQGTLPSESFLDDSGFVGVLVGMVMAVVVVISLIFFFKNKKGKNQTAQEV
jgi:hypothetical protein